MSVTLTKKQWEKGLNDAGRTFYHGSAYHECLCGFMLPVDRQGYECSAQFPNWNRLVEHQKTCQAVLDDWEKNKVLCRYCQRWVHRKYDGGSPCDRCIEHSE